ncbi:MAG: 30S ribosomal protein S15 [bacterium]|nr:30S ribosomal protein S15 [bacterium]
MPEATQLLKKYQTHKEDTGSTSVQIILLTERINDLSDHLKSHKKDFDSRRGLLKMVGHRRALLNYIRQRDIKHYEVLINDLGLRK